MEIITSITHSFAFHAAHKLDWHRGKCSRLHGHTYRCEITIRGELGPSGIVVDFDELQEITDREVMNRLDHQYLNEIVENPTAERIASYIMELLRFSGQDVTRVRLWETDASSAIVELA